MIQSLGKVVVTTAGTPVQMTQNSTNQTKVRCHSFMVEALSANSGKIYIGAKGMSKTTLAGVYAILPVPTANILPSFSATLTLVPDAFIPSTIYIDADVSGEGVLASIVVS